MRLIDANNVIDDIKWEMGETYDDDVRAGMKSVIDIINKRRTAYDVDKVVEELNKIKKYNLNLADMMIDIQENGTNRHFICLEDAIKIVKSGGIDDKKRRKID